MPQMAPYNWLVMFMYFNMIMIMIISMNYYMNSDFLINKMTLPKYKYKFMW